MKKFFSHSLFYCIFALLGLVGMGLQSWYLKTAPDSTGLLVPDHPGIWLTFALLGLVLVLTIVSTKHIRAPKLSTAMRSVGAALTAVFTAIASGVLFSRQNYLLFGLCALSAISSLYILWAQTTGRKPHYTAYGLFAVCFMFYLISRYQTNSAEPETARYVFQTLALVCLMLVFYQQAAIRAGTGRFGSYHVWRSLALFLSLTAIPGSHNPMLYLAGVFWLLVDPLPRPKTGDPS